MEIEQTLVDGARSSLTYEYARKSETVMAAVSSVHLVLVLYHRPHTPRSRLVIKQKRSVLIRQASSAYLNEALKGVGKNYDQEMLKKLPVSPRRLLSFIPIPLFNLRMIPQTSAARRIDAYALARPSRSTLFVKSSTPTSCHYSLPRRQLEPYQCLQERPTRFRKGSKS